MSDEEVFFPPYGKAKLEALMAPHLEEAFHDDALSDEVGRMHSAKPQTTGTTPVKYSLFRQAGETATERDVTNITQD